MTFIQPEDTRRTLTDKKGDTSAVSTILRTDFHFELPHCKYAWIMGKIPLSCISMHWGWEMNPG